MLPSASTHRASPGHLHTQKWRGRVGLALVASLSVLAGMTDAIGFMASGDFVSFMSGNTTRLAVAAGSEQFAAVLHLGLLVLVFVLGNAFGVMFAHLTGRRHGVIVGLVAALLLASAARRRTGGSKSSPGAACSPAPCSARWRSGWSGRRRSGCRPASPERSRSPPCSSRPAGVGSILRRDHH